MPYHCAIDVGRIESAALKHSAYGDATKLARWDGF